MATDLTPIGEHALLDLTGAGRLGDADFLEEAMREAARVAGATVIGAHFHHFGEGHGVTGILLLAESHISVHTWPERDFAAFDIFMCGAASTAKAAASIGNAFPEAKVDVRSVRRG